MLITTKQDRKIMKYTINIEKEIDLDEIKTNFFTNPELRNTLIRVLGTYETSFVDFVVQDGIASLEANLPNPISPEEDSETEDECTC